MRSLRNIIRFAQSEGLTELLRRVVVTILSPVHKDQTAVVLVRPLRADYAGGSAWGEPKSRGGADPNQRDALEKRRECETAGTLETGDESRMSGASPVEEAVWTDHDRFGTIREVGQDEAFDHRGALYLEAATLHSRFARGDRLFGAFDGDRLMAYAWLAIGGEWLTTIEREFRVGDREVYVYNVRTLPPYRGRGIFPSIIRVAVPRLLSQGCARLVTVVEARNAPSIRAFEKAGFHRVRSVRMRKILGRRRYFEREVGGAGASDRE